MTLLTQYLKEQQINGLSNGHIKNLASFFKYANEFKPLEDWIKDDIDNYVLKLQGEYKKSTVEHGKRNLKKFFKWAGKSEIVEHLKVKDIKTPLKADDILTVDEVNRLIEATPSTLYKALIAFLFESGARVSEVLNIKVTDFKETDKGMIASIPQTKTGEDYRQCLCIFSAQYIRNHITYCALDKDDNLFSITPVSVWEMLGKIRDRAGITKPVHAHSFRHASASDMVRRGYQESIIRKKHGWTANSDMIERYIHLNDEDVINAMSEKSGAAIEKKPIGNLKQAEPLKIADAAATIRKLEAELAELKEERKQLGKEILAEVLKVVQKG